MDHVSALTQQFLLQIQVLAREHGVLKYQQEGQNHAQNAALMAVPASTEIRNVQDERGGQIESYVSDRLTQASQDVQYEFYQKMMLMERNMDGTLSRIMEQVQNLIKDKLIKDNLKAKTAQMVQTQMEKSTDHAAAEINGACAQTRR
ncbi:unnamed protein product [Hyaloperonospora brassicae]|uniref:Uncharacterized protein n=1 Tax=Hyaloperonospora brassicae TaxID=162125 RepID=A0AAV0UGG3_HYABA|nr:unnamed protein product [Hyaloperonospora brassicae]